MKRFLAFLILLVGVSAFGANPSYKDFRGTGGISIVSNPPNGTIVIDGSAISGSSAVPGGATYSVQWNTNGALAGDGHFQYTPELGGGDPSAKLRLSYSTSTNMFSAIGVGSASSTEFFLMSGGLSRWGLGTSGDLNTFSDAASYSIGTIGLNRRPFYVNVQSSFNVNDRYALSASGTQWQVGNDGGWASGSLVANGAVRLAVASGGNIGIGTVTPTAHLTVTNDTITGAIAAFYASNNPAPALLINSNSWVGLGTNVPASRLHVRPATSGQSYFRVDDTNGTARLQVGVYPGSPSYAGVWLGDVVPSSVNFALYSSGVFATLNAGNSLRLATAGVERWSIDANGHFLAQTDNTYDIGAAGATRPRNIHVGTTIALAGNLFLDATIAGCFLLRDPGATNFVRLQLGGTTAAFPGLGRTNGHLSVMGANGAVDGTSTNGLWVMGGPIIQDFTVTAPAAPSRQGAVYWNDGTNVCVVLRNSAGGLSTNKLSMTAWP